MSDKITGKQTLVRASRQLIDFFSHKTIYKPSADGSHSRVELNVGDTALLNTNDSPGRAGMKTATKLIEDGGEFVRTPLKWVKDMQDNWLIYVVCAAVVCLCTLYLYCMVRRYFARKRNSSTGSTSHLLELAAMMTNGRANHKQAPIGSVSQTVATTNSE